MYCLALLTACVYLSMRHGAEDDPTYQAESCRLRIFKAKMLLFGGTGQVIGRQNLFLPEERAHASDCLLRVYVRQNLEPCGRHL